MWRTNLAIVLTVLGTLAVYTAVANVIPQVESDVPTELSFGAEVTAEQLVTAGEQVYAGAGGCTACHGLGTRAPDLLGTAGTICETRVPELSCKEYLYQSLTEPTAYVVEGFQPIMPDMRRTLSNEQIWAAVAFLESQGGTVDVTGEDLASTDPREIIAASGCMACHALDGQGGPVGPPFDGMGARIEADRIRRGILEPNADTARGYEAMAGTMPPTFGETLTAAQLEALVRFLAERK